MYQPLNNKSDALYESVRVHNKPQKDCGFQSKHVSRVATAENTQILLIISNKIEKTTL